LLLKFLNQNIEFFYYKYIQQIWIESQILVLIIIILFDKLLNRSLLFGKINEKIATTWCILDENLM